MTREVSIGDGGQRQIEAYRRKKGREKLEIENKDNVWEVFFCKKKNKNVTAVECGLRWLYF